VRRPATLEFENFGFMGSDVAEQLVPDRPLAIEPPSLQGLEAGLPVVGQLLFGHREVGGSLLY
jgi:hypothetical protein